MANFDTKFAGFEIVVCFHMKILSNAFYGFSLLSYIISFGEVVPPSVNLTSNVKMERKYHHDFKDLEVFCRSNLKLVLEIELTMGRFWHVLFTSRVAAWSGKGLNGGGGGGVN